VNWPSMVLLGIKPWPMHVVIVCPPPCFSAAFMHCFLFTPVFNFGISGKESQGKVSDPLSKA